MTRHCPGCHRRMKLSYGNTTLPHDKLIPLSNALWTCPYCIELSMKVRDKFIELHKAEATLANMSSEEIEKLKETV
jgi:hypothetical protein